MSKKKLPHRGRHNTKVITDDVIALRRMRLSRKITREDAGKCIGHSAKLIERFENGRANLSEEKKKALIRRYRYSLKEYYEILEGKLLLPDIPARSIYTFQRKDRKEGRKYQKIITKEARVLKSLRKICGLTQPQAAKLCGYSRSVIDHLENGRVEITIERIGHIVRSLGKTMEDFHYLIEQKVLRDEVVENCKKIIDGLNSEKLQAVEALLVNFK